MKRLLSERVVVNTVMREDKPKFCTGKGCVLIDDVERNIRDWNAMGGTGILHVDPKDTLQKLKEIEMQ